MVADRGRLDLPVRSFAFAVRIVRLCRALDRQPGISRAVALQLLRCGTSIGANVEEAWGAQSLRDYLTKISIACKEARETLYWLRLLAETGLMRSDRLIDIARESGELVAILSAIARRTKQKVRGA